MKKLVLLFLFLAGALCAEPPMNKKVPNFTLTNQNNKAVSLYDFKGKVVLITFLYTQCPYPDKCPMLAEKLGKTADLIDQIEGAKDKVQVISITLDPKRDTPESLKKYAQGHDASENWTFLTGKAKDVSKVASFFDVIYYTEKGVIEHNMRTIILDRDLKLVKVYKNNDWKPGELAAAIRDLVTK